MTRYPMESSSGVNDIVETYMGLAIVDSRNVDATVNNSSNINIEPKHHDVGNRERRADMAPEGWLQVKRDQAGARGLPGCGPAAQSSIMQGITN